MLAVDSHHARLSPALEVVNNKPDWFAFGLAFGQRPGLEQPPLAHASGPKTARSPGHGKQLSGLSVDPPNDAAQTAGPEKKDADWKMQGV